MRARFGNKADALLALQLKGFDVPPLICFSVEKLLETFCPDSLKKTYQSFQLLPKTEAKELYQKLNSHLESLESKELLKSFPELEAFFAQNLGKPCAVRSSSLSEDSKKSACAGMFSTFLNLRSLDAIIKAMKSAWISQISEVAYDFYKEKDLRGDAFGMGLIVMIQIRSKASGVVFSQDPLSSTPSAIVESCFGQGEQIVSGLVVPDRFVLKNGKLSETSKGKQFSIAQASQFHDGLEKEDVSPEKVSQLSLSSRQAELIALKCEEARSALGFQEHVDMEWAIDMDDSLWILQCRPVTTQQGVSWDPPGPGFWIFDTTHFPNQQSKIFECVFEEFNRGWRASLYHVGSLLDIQFLPVNGYIYANVQPRKVRIDDLIATSENFLKKKGWLDDFNYWKNHIAPELQKRHFLLRDRLNQDLSDSSFLDLWYQILNSYKRAFFYHQRFTASLMTAIGWYLDEGKRLSGKSDVELLSLLQGAANETRSLWSEKVQNSIRKVFDTNESKKKLADATTLDELSLPKERKLIDSILSDFGHFTISGFDASGPILEEQPNIVLERFKKVVFQTTPSSLSNTENGAEFSQLLEETRHISSFRDMRAMYSDVQASGLLRKFLKKMWSRKRFEGEWTTLLSCSPSEIEKLLIGNQDVSLDDIRKVAAARASIKFCPPFLGVPEPEGDLSMLPKAIFQGEMARKKSLMMTLHMPPETNGEEIIGRPACSGIIEGRARIVELGKLPSDLREGDIAVISCTLSSFNNILPIFSAIVTDFGGVLSHAAVSAREFDIPCVVGTGNATSKIKDYSIIRVNGFTGQVHVID